MITTIVLDVLFVGWDIVIIVIIFLDLVFIPVGDCYPPWVIFCKETNAVNQIIWNG